MTHLSLSRTASCSRRRLQQLLCVRALTRVCLLPEQLQPLVFFQTLKTFVLFGPNHTHFLYDGVSNVVRTVETQFQ